MNRVVILLIFITGGCNAHGSQSRSVLHANCECAQKSHLPLHKGKKGQMRANFGEVWQCGQAGAAGPLTAIAALLLLSDLPLAWQSRGTQRCLGSPYHCKLLARPRVGPVMATTDKSNFTKGELVSELSLLKGGLAGAIAPILPIPQFRWTNVVFLLTNSLVLSALAVLAKFLFGVEWLGAKFSMTFAAALHGVYWLMTFIMIDVMALFIPAFAEMKKATQTIVLYAFGGRFVPLRAVVAATILAGASAVGEELLFRGIMQTLFTMLLVSFLSVEVATQLAVAIQALIFGVLHSYTPSPIYFLAASMAGYAFGEAFALTGNIFVPIVMHFFNNLAAFMRSHVQVSRATRDEQRALILDASPIASRLRVMFYPAPKQGRG